MKNWKFNLHNRIPPIKIGLQMFYLLFHLHRKLLRLYPFSLNLGLNWGYDVTKEGEFWNFEKLTFITEFYASKLVYMQIFNVLFHLDMKLLQFYLFPLNFGLNWRYDVTKEGQFWKFENLTFITELYASKLVYMQIFNFSIDFVTKLDGLLVIGELYRVNYCLGHMTWYMRR